MNGWLLTLTALALSMDAFAVSVCCGISGRSADKRLKWLSSISFGLFQGIMPLLGYLLSRNFSDHFEQYSGIIAFLILSVIGFKMVIESLSKKDRTCRLLNVGSILLLSLATSIDAFATGIGFGLLEINIIAAALLIGFITFAVSLLGSFFGDKIGAFIRNRAETVGGVILILIGLKILLESII
ncbi:MAG: manganese efflux pump MntP family protein [Clostridia bacterium]